MFESELLWNKNAGGWFIFNENWGMDTNDKIKSYCIKLFDEMRKHTSDWKKTETGEEEEMKNNWIRHVKNSGQSVKMSSMLECAKPLMAFDGEFDNNHWLFNCKNGTINLKTGDLYKHDPQDYISKICNVPYKTTAKCDKWLAFLKDIFFENEDVIKYMQKVVGYSLTGLTTEQCFFILWGNGANGKSTFVETITYILNNYALTCDSKTLMQKDGNQINNDIARLRGSRFVSAAENNRRKEFDESVIKRLTGNDKIIARFLNKENFEFYPTCKIFLTTNHKPNIRSIDDGIWRRIRMIPFLFKVDESRMDRFLGEKLKEEAEGILAWMVQGCLLWVKEGLKEPKFVEDAGKKYKFEEDRIGNFIADECILGKKLFIPVPVLKEKLWEYLGFKIGNKSIGEYFQTRGFSPGRTNFEGKQTRVYFGIGLRSDYPDVVNDVADEPSENIPVQAGVEPILTTKEHIEEHVEDQIEWET
jgi:putative DNA primase/helicase